MNTLSVSKNNICFLRYFSFNSWNEIEAYVLFSAGIHHLVLDQNLLLLKRDLVIGDRVKRFWQKYSSKEVDFSLTLEREERIQSFIEWLQMQPLKEYKHFIRLLEKTNQERLAAQLVASCKPFI